jgi:predicted metal-dependent hydrolase
MQLSLFDTVSQILHSVGGQLSESFTKPFVSKPSVTPVPPAKLTPPIVAITPASKVRSLQLKTLQIQYSLKRSSKRRTIGFVINDNGLSVAAPKWVTITQVEESLREREDWIIRKTFEWQEFAKKRDSLRVDWGNGAKVRYLGDEITVRLDDSPEVTKVGFVFVTAERQELRIALPPQASDEQIKNKVESWLQLQAKKIFAERIPLYSQKLGSAPTRWGLSSARTRWGSCAHDGSIRLNWRLVQFPLDIIDYVVAHELAHLKELNHGPDFWRTVGELFPDYEQKRRWLKQHHVEQ